MQIVLPDTPGWSAAHASNAEWGSTAIIAKRRYVRSGASADASDPEEVRTGDVVETRSVGGDDTVIIARESELAFFKTRADVLALGWAGVPAGAVTGASLSLNGVERRRFAGLDARALDPVNLFGYEPRRTRIPGGYDMATFTFAGQGGALFQSARRSGGWTLPNTALTLTGAQRIEVAVTTAAGTETVADVTLTLPAVTATPFVWEGGSNKPAYWCRRADVPLVADTITLTEADVTVLWRGALPLADAPLADIRQVTLKEVTP